MLRELLDGLKAGHGAAEVHSPDSAKGAVNTATTPALPDIEPQRIELLGHILSEVLQNCPLSEREQSEIRDKLAGINAEVSELIALLSENLNLLQTCGLNGLRSLTSLSDKTEELPTLLAVKDNLNEENRHIVETLAVSTTEELIAVLNEHPTLLEYGTALCLSKDDLAYIWKPRKGRVCGLPCTLRELHELVKKYGHITEKPHKGLVESIVYDIRSVGYWRDSGIEKAQARKIIEAANTFGFAEIITFALNDDKRSVICSRKKGMYPIDAALKAVELSGLSAENIFYRLLLQVRDDSTVYSRKVFGETGDSNNARQEFTQIMATCEFNTESILEEVRKYPALNELLRLAEEFQDPKNIFASWASLKQYAELERYIESPEILEALQLAKEENPALFDFVAPMFFKSGSKVKKEAIEQFVIDPATFMRRKDTDGTWTNSNMGDFEVDGVDLQDMITPKAMVDGAVKGLDLSASELRDAYINGSYQNVCPIVPLRIDYKIPVDENVRYATVRDALKAAVGVRSEGIKGIAARPRKVFQSVQKLLNQELELSNKEAQRKVGDYVNNVEDLPFEVEEKVIALIYDAENGLQHELMEMRAEIHPLADATGVTSADEIALCDSFGTGKRNVYMFDPGSTAVTIQLKDSIGVWRTIAGSVLYFAFQSEVNYRNVRSKLWGPNSNMAAILKDSPPVLTNEAHMGFDNIEMRSNERDHNLGSITAKLLEELVGVYTTRFGKTHGISTTRALMGQASSDVVTRRWVPYSDAYTPYTAPIGYTDWRNCKSSGTTHEMPAKRRNDAYPRSIHFDEDAATRLSGLRLKVDEADLSELGYLDALAAA